MINKPIFLATNSALEDLQLMALDGYYGPELAALTAGLDKNNLAALVKHSGVFSSRNANMVAAAETQANQHPAPQARR